MRVEAVLLLNGVYNFSHLKLSASLKGEVDSNILSNKKLRALGLVLPVLGIHKPVFYSQLSSLSLCSKYGKGRIVGQLKTTRSRPLCLILTVNFSMDLNKISKYIFLYLSPKLRLNIASSSHCYLKM